MADSPSTDRATVPDDPAVAARTALKARLTAAMKVRDRVAMAALRSALGAIDNAEAVGDASVEADLVPSRPPATSEHVAGGVVGVGAAEVARRTLSAAQVRAVIVAEITDRTTAIDAFPAGNVRAADRVAELRHEIDVLNDALGELEP